ncbi:hypothetical protein [Nocardia africana]|uniref:Uncharacterized protein n=1 Tax=Nocardia africana TaxID=134964 RepID=A0A378WKB5_9NOCA|nr:hypothetical protein [Nocardia africana]MCC3315958.1 hypothetical protein [Nocardia africana]SUA41710.1 Uncharacterised protein [Nocardia africana]
MMQSSALGRAGSRLSGHSREVAKRFVIDKVESTGAATRDDFDIDLIVTTVHQQTDDWNFQAMPASAFWRIVSNCFEDEPARVGADD